MTQSRSRRLAVDQVTAPSPKEQPSAQPSAQIRRRKSRPGWTVGKPAYALLAGSLLALVGVLTDVRSLIRNPDTVPSPLAVCQEIVQPEAVLSRAQLADLLAVGERESQARVREIVQAPYCKLPDLEIRAGVVAEREAYPLEFDPDTWFVVLYEGEEYAGYDFSFHH